MTLDKMSDREFGESVDAHNDSLLDAYLDDRPPYGYINDKYESEYRDECLRETD